MAVKSVAALKAFIDANRTSNGINSNTGATENTILNDIVDSFFSKLGTPAVTGSGAANRITRWASANVAQSGTWTNTVNALVPVTNNSTLGSATLGVQMFGAAATTTTAPINLKSSAAVIPTGIDRKSGMLLWDGTSLLFHTADNTAASDLLASHPSITANVIPKGNGGSVVDGSWEFDTNDIFPTTTESNIGKITTNTIKTIFGKQFTIGELPADTSGLYLAAQSKFTATNYALFQDNTTGVVFHNAQTSMSFTIDNGTTIMRLETNKVQLATNSSDTVEIGNSIGLATGALVYTSGKGDTSATINMDLANQSETVLFRFRDDGRFGVGLTSMTAVLDVKGGIATEAQFRLRTGTTQTTTDRLNGSFNWNDTNKLLDFFRTDNTAPSVIEMATTPITSTPGGTTQTINWQDGSFQILDLGSASGDVTLTLTNPVAGSSYMLKIIQGATARDVVLPATVLIPGGTAPTTIDITITDNAEDTLTMGFDGTNYYGQVGENHG